MVLDPGAEREAGESPGRGAFERALPHVAAAVGFLRRRHRLSREEAEDFLSFVHEKLLEDDCRRLRAFSGRSKLSTYLATVVSRLFVDYRRQAWGPRWSPSAIAVRLGPLAVRLEELWQRDGRGLAEASAWLVQHAGADAGELEKVAAQLPARERARFEPAGGDGPEPADPAPDPESVSLAAERAGEYHRLAEALQRSLAELPAEDAAILRLHYLQGWTLAAVAQALRLEQRPLYRRRDRLLGELRLVLAAGGWGEVEAKRLLDTWRPEE
jgi:RNA polymerase sigma factor (sigma-70 family)